MTKTFDSKSEAKRWALANELEKRNGKQLAERNTTFADFFENWIHIIKKNDVKEEIFQNYMRTSHIVKKMFGDIQLKDLNDIVVQPKIDEYAKNHSRKTTHEVLLKIKTALCDAYARGFLATDFASLVKTRGKELPKRNRTLSISYLRKLRTYLLKNTVSELMRWCCLRLKQVCDVENY
ncbi:hypothetical protein [Lysinibacillus sphaericus]|uniref:hypothetical protein n=1 Tax=Lysinibacillus sphaericus TaxID=1421 RepID=UPI000AC32687|nr:hypothetical protein [Lysinibacillus sphaericus]